MNIFGKNKIRVLLDLGLIVSLFLLPTYITIFLAFIISIYIFRYIEFPIIAFFIDSIYKPFEGASLGLFGISIIVIVLIEYFRDRVKLKGKDTL